ncbi:glycosyltransferase family 2 protein [Aeromonas caviae]|uniref:glycosyltransferase family 2 protein n=1 Tax=Aeromonas caviae TaxID=648 RepID=UPI000B052C56|nr:glycosyltransferase family 2 protein [Aeromonas caviae]AUU21586.1 rhamnosyltransferase [Aeromonas caviae]QOK20560.1 glycosyltransferase family 2 protein [Aeromonas caviae]
MKISSVTVTYNPEVDLLVEQLNSLKDQVDFIIVVDNGSINVSDIESIIKNYRAVLVKINENKGLSYAQNVGIARAIDDGSQYLLLLDQDSILQQNFVKNICDIYIESGVGILGPVFYDPNNLELYKGTNYIGPFIRTTKIGRTTDVTYVIASGSFFSTDVFKKIGPMNEGLFVDYIDVDWSLRAKSIGLRVAMTNLSRMSHTIGDSRINFLGRTISVHSPMRRYYLIRNSFFMLRMPYVPFGYKLRELSLNVVRAAIAIFVSKDRVAAFKMITKGFKDGVNGTFGPYKS